MRGFVALVVLVLVTGRAVADPTVAKRLFAEGRVLYDQGKYIEACVLFEKSYQLDPAVGTKLNLAECAERDGKPRAAWLLWISAADEFERADDNREKFARDRADALAPKLATVIVRVAKPQQTGLTVQIAGREVVPAKTIVDRLDPGAIAVAASAPGREPFQTTISVAVGGTVEVEIPALPRIGGVADTEDESRSTGRNHWWTGAIVSGIAAVVASGVYVFSYKKIKDTEAALEVEVAREPPNLVEIERLNEEGRAWELRTRLGLGLAIGGAVLTTVFVVKARRVDRQRATSTAWQMTPVIAPRIAGAVFELRW